jgi:hypothetical protein
VRDKHSVAFVALLVLAHPALRYAQEEPPPTAEEWRRAARQIRWLPPSAFKDAPKWVVDDLAASGCTIPQPSPAGEPVNLIRGQFARRGEWDWAAVCSKGGKSRVVILWGGQPACPSDLWEVEDADRLEVMAPGEIGYDFTLIHLGPGAIRKDIHDWEPPPWEAKVKAVTHDGIELGTGKGADILYCRSGEWTVVASGD